jgi:hypothetical protein
MIPISMEPTEPGTDAVEAAAAVEVAKVEADRDVKIAEEDTKRAEVYAAEENAELRGRVAALEETVAKLTPPEPAPEPEPVVIVEPPAEPAEPEPAVEPPPAENKPAAPKTKRSGWWG